MKRYIPEPNFASVVVRAYECSSYSEGSVGRYNLKCGVQYSNCFVCVRVCRLLLYVVEGRKTELYPLRNWIN